ncbi:membrane hypothetical protein [Bacillus subtilis]
MKEKPRSLNIFSIDSAFVIGYITILGYYVAYKYQEGYYSFFNVPLLYLDKVNLYNLIESTGTMVTLIIAIPLVMYFIFMNIIRSIENPIMKRLEFLIMPTIYLLGMLIYFDSLRLLFLILLLIMYGYVFLLPILLYFNTPGYYNKLNAFHGPIEKETFIERLQQNIKFQPIASLCIFILLSQLLGGMASLAGYQSIARKSTFDVTEINNSNYIVIDRQGDNLIVTELKNNKITNKYKAIKLENVLIEKRKILNVNE